MINYIVTLFVFHARTRTHTGTHTHTQAHTHAHTHAHRRTDAQMQKRNATRGEIG